MTSIQTINLTQLNWSIPAVIHAVQNDTGRTPGHKGGDYYVTDRASVF